MIDAEHPWPDRLATRYFEEAPAGSFHKHQVHRPTGIVVHSGDLADRVAESVLHDKRGVSYHFAHSHKLGVLIQLVSLRDRAYHASVEGNDAIGIGLSGPWGQSPRANEERGDFRALVLELQAAFGRALQWYCRHSDITPGKRDPGPGFLPEWIEDLGFTHDARGPRFWG
jgi:N-acetyl-anhydromuramyl-L-alanine amidase AmpD